MVEENWKEYLIFGQYLPRNPCTEKKCIECGARNGSLHLLACTEEVCAYCTEKLETCGCQALPTSSPSFKKRSLQDNIFVLESLMKDAEKESDIAKMRDIIQLSFDYIRDSNKLLGEL